MALNEYGVEVKVKADLGNTDKKLAGLNSQSLSLVKNLSRTVLGIGSLSAALLVMKRDVEQAYKALQKFNEGLGNVATLIPGNIKRVEELKESLKEMAVMSGKSLEDLTEGLYQVISAFGDSADTEARLNVVTKAGLAGRASTIDSLNMLSAVTKAYGDISAQAMQKVSDLSFLTLKLGQTTFPELANAIQQVTDSSVRLEVSQEELFASFATLTGVSGSAGTVATQLRSALVALEAPSKELSVLYQELGVASGKALIQQYGLQGALKEVIDYSNRTGVSLQSLLGRVQAMSAASNLGASQAETYAWKLEEIRGYAGATDIALAEVTSGIDEQGFALKQLSAQYEVFKVNVGEKMGPVFASFINSLKDMFAGLNAQYASVYQLETSYNDLVTASGNYNAIVNQLAQSQGQLTDIEERMLKIRKDQAALEVQKQLQNMAKGYSGTKQAMQDYADSIRYNEERQVHWANRIEELKAQLEGLTKGSRKYHEVSGNLSSAHDSLTSSTLNLASAQSNLQSIQLEQEATLIEIAQAYKNGQIDIEAYKDSFPELYETIKKTAEQIKAEDIVPSLAPASAIDADKVIEGFVGFGPKELKAKLAEYQALILSLEERLKLGEMDVVDFNKTHDAYRAIAKGLEALIIPAEKEYVETQKKSLEAKLLEMQATGGLSALEATRLNTLADINDKIGENAELTNLVNEIYKVGADKIVEAYEEQLLAQEQAVGSTNVLLDIERERAKALKEQRDLGLDTIENQERLNALYDKQKEVLISTALESLVYANAMLKETDALARNEIERKKAIDESNRKYGYQIGLINEINKKFDQQAIKIKEQESYYTKLEKKFEEAIGAEAYKKLDKFGKQIVKTGELVNDLSPIWNSLGRAISSFQTTQQALLNRAASDAQKYYEKMKEESDEVVDGLDDENKERLDALQEMYDSDAISYEEYMDRKADIDSQYAKDKKKALRQTIKAENDAKMAQYEAEKAQFQATKSSAIANAIISGAQGIMAAWARGPILGIAGSAVIAGAMAYQIAQINQQPAPSPPTLTPFAEGGIVTRPTQALIGEAGEPEAVIPLSKASMLGFGFSGGGGDVYNISGNTFLGIDGVDELLLMLEQRKKALIKQGRMA